MRFVLMTAAFLTVASLLFNGYLNGRNEHPSQPAGANLFPQVEKASQVNLIIGEAASAQRAELEKQTR
jgi:hypothetical protein